MNKTRMWLPFVEALYMYHTFGVVSHVKNVAIQDIVPDCDCDFGGILEDYKHEKFYIADEWVSFFEPKDGDINKLFEEVDDIEEAIYRREIIMRNWKNFFMPKIEVM